MQAHWATPHLVANAQAVAFLWGAKAGFLLGMQHMSGFVLAKQGGDAWSAPCFVSLAAGEAGVLIGVEKVGGVTWRGDVAGWRWWTGA
jgi:lipid-binding SYLF domain-containing protein